MNYKKLPNPKILTQSTYVLIIYVVLEIQHTFVLPVYKIEFRFFITTSFYNFQIYRNSRKQLNLNYRLSSTTDTLPWRLSNKWCFLLEKDRIAAQKKIISILWLQYFVAWLGFHFYHPMMMHFYYRMNLETKCKTVKKNWSIYSSQAYVIPRKIAYLQLINDIKSI